MYGGTEAAAEGLRGGVRRDGGVRRTPPDDVLARGRRPAPSAVQGGAEEAGAEDGGAEGLGRRARRGPDGGGGVGDGRRPASISSGGDGDER